MLVTLRQYANRRRLQPPWNPLGIAWEKQRCWWSRVRWTVKRFFLTQLNTIPTRGDKVLDLVITSVASQVNDISVLSPKESGLFTDHGTIVFHLKKAAPPKARTVYDYSRGDFNGLRSAIVAIDLCSTINTDDVNLIWHQWKDAFLTAVQDYIPIKKHQEAQQPTLDQWRHCSRPQEERVREAEIFELPNWLYTG